MKRTAITILLLIAIAGMALAWLNVTSQGKKFEALHIPATPVKNKARSIPIEKLAIHSREARLFVENNRYNTDFYFLIDLSLLSGQKRFFIYDLKKDSLLTSGLVTHGNCNQYWLEGRRYDNVVGCGCSSLGKYRVGVSYQGRFGLAYKLHGLDSTNSNAFKRYVVLHSHECVPENEVTTEICQSNGCPTVSPEFLKHLERMIKGSKKPVLMWITE